MAKALDAEMRARIDALALTTHPMMAVDATRIPRDKFSASANLLITVIPKSDHAV